MSERQTINNDDRDLAAAIKRAAPRDSEIPHFNTVFTRAERQLRDRQRTRRRLLGSAAAMVLIAVAGFVVFDSDVPIAEPAFVQADELLSSTQWRAPSDVLLPTYDIDLYQELPVLLESTKPVEGALL